MVRSGLLFLVCILLFSAAVCCAVDESFNGELNRGLWKSIGPDNSITIANATCTIHRTESIAVGLKGTPATALLPDNSGLVRLDIDFAPESSFITKNNFYFGVTDESGDNSIFVQTGNEFSWGWWGVAIKSNGVVKRSERFYILNALPSKNWRFDISDGRVRIYYGTRGEYEYSLFDSRREKPADGGDWSVPMVAMSPLVLDNQSTGKGDVVLELIKYNYVEVTPEIVYSIEGNGLGDEIILASDGLPRAVIVVPDGPMPSILVAANDIRSTIKQSTGAALPIVEESDYTGGACITLGSVRMLEGLGVNIQEGGGFRDEHIIVKRIKDKVVVVGNDTVPFNGTMDAAIRFLNAGLGADYFYAAPTGKVVPKLDRLIVSELDLDEKPASMHRDLRSYAQGDGAALRKTLPEWQRWNHNGGTAIHHQHIFMEIAPPSKYFESHPEYFSEIRGKRSISEPEGWQLCTTNPDVIKLAVNFCRTFLDNNPTYHTASLSMNDCRGVCTCEKCRKLDSPDPVSGFARRAVVFANTVAREIAKTHPGKGVSFYAYLATLEPPMDVKCDSNVVVVLADSGSCVFHTYNDKNCGLARDAKLRLQAWQKICNEVVVYDYYSYYGGYLGLPFSNLKRTIENARYAQKYGAQGFTYDASFLPGPQGLHHWAAMRVLWDKDLTPESALKYYCDKLYGNASNNMQYY